MFLSGLFDDGNRFCIAKLVLLLLLLLLLLQYPTAYSFPCNLAEISSGFNSVNLPFNIFYNNITTIASLFSFEMDTSTCSIYHTEHRFIECCCCCCECPLLSFYSLSFSLFLFVTFVVVYRRLIFYPSNLRLGLLCNALLDYYLLFCHTLSTLLGISGSTVSAVAAATAT